jgi:mutator protein MutT
MMKGIDYIGVGVGAVILNKHGDIFLAKRGKEARNERYKWEFPGGSVEFGENLEDAVIREVKEEYDFEIAIERLLDVVNHVIPEEQQHWVSPTYLCTYIGGSPRIMESDKCIDIGWFSLDRIPEADLTIASRKSLQSLKQFFSTKQRKQKG